MTITELEKEIIKSIKIESEMTRMKRSWNNAK